MGCPGWEAAEGTGRCWTYMDMYDVARTNTQRRRRPNDRCRRQGITPLEDNIILRSVVPLPTGSSGIHRNTEFVSTTTYAECAGRQRERQYGTKRENSANHRLGAVPTTAVDENATGTTARPWPHHEGSSPWYRQSGVGDAIPELYTDHKAMNRFRNSTDDGRMCFWGGPCVKRM